MLPPRSRQPRPLRRPHRLSAGPSKTTRQVKKSESSWTRRPWSSTPATVRLVGWDPNWNSFWGATGGEKWDEMMKLAYDKWVTLQHHRFPAHQSERMADRLALFCLRKRLCTKIYISTPLADGRSPSQCSGREPARGHSQRPRSLAPSSKPTEKPQLSS